MTARKTATKSKTKSGNSKPKPEEVLDTKESTNMAAKKSSKDALLDSVNTENLDLEDNGSKPGLKVNYDFSEWTVDWEEKIGQNGYPYGYVDLKAPDCPEYESLQEALDLREAMYYGKGEDRFTALTAASAFGSLCKQWYAFVGNDVVIGLNPRSDESAGYVLHTNSGSVDINGKAFDVPVPEKQGMWALGGDALLGLHALPKTFVDPATAKESIQTKLEEMPKHVAKRMKSYWKAHALMSFTSFKWIRIYFRYKSIEYVRTCVVTNRFDQEKTNDSINGAAFNDRERAHEGRIKRQFQNGKSVATGYKGQELEMHDVFLLSLKDYDGKFGTVVNKVKLSADTVKTLNGSTFKTAEIREDGTVRTVSAWFPQDEADLVDMFNTCSANKRSLVQIQ